jgi:hypothetical protein
MGSLFSCILVNRAVPFNAAILLVLKLIYLLYQFFLNLMQSILGICPISTS